MTNLKLLQSKAKGVLSTLAAGVTIIGSVLLVFSQFIAAALAVVIFAGLLLLGLQYGARAAASAYSAAATAVST